VLTTNQKGAIAEAAIMKAAFELGYDVYRPAIEGGRYDLIIDLEPRLLRVQCKWAVVRKRDRRDSHAAMPTWSRGADSSLLRAGGDRRDRRLLR
jgi:hypothetical protein